MACGSPHLPPFDVARSTGSFVSFLWYPAVVADSNVLLFDYRAWVLKDLGSIVFMGRADVSQVGLCTSS